MAISGAYFDVVLVGVGVVLAGGFLSVSGLDMEADYEVYTEGGSNYPRFFFKNVVPQHLVLEKGVITTVDSMSMLTGMVNQGMSIPLAGTIILRDSFGSPQREWSIVGAHLQKYVGPQLNSNQASQAVSRVELIYDGCY